MNFLAHLFVPRYSNNHKPKLLQTSGLLLLIIGLIVFQGVLGIVSFRKGSVLGFAAQIAPSEVIRLTNEKRVAQGLTLLKENPVLSRAALAKGMDMIKKGYWAHVSPEGTQPWKFFVDAGYKYRYAGENLARDFSNPSSAVEAWMASASHKENLLSPRYREIGIGVVEGQMAGADTTIIVQFFGTAMADTIPVAPVAKTNPQTPTPAPAAVVKIVPEVNAASAFTATPLEATKYVSFAVVGILVFVVVLDGFVLHRRKIARSGGRHLAHFAFLGMILAIVVIAKAGRIL